MANNWQLGMIAGLDGTQSRNQLNSDIKGLARSLDKLKLYTEIDKNQVIQLQNQLKKLQIDLNTVTVTDAAINGLVQKINDGLKNIQISNINVGNIGNVGTQAQQVGQQIGQQIQNGINSASRNGSSNKLLDNIKESIGINGKTTTQINTLTNSFKKLGLSSDEVISKMQGVTTEYNTLKNMLTSGASESDIVNQFKKMNSILTQTQNSLKQTRSEYSLLVTAQQRLALANTIESWNQKNTAATKEAIKANEQYIASLRDLNTQMTKMQYGNIQTAFKQTENQMRGMNRLGLALKDQWKQATQSFTMWVSASSAVMKIISETRQAVTEIKEVDNILTEISKTSDITNQKLNELGQNSYNTASKYGRTATDYLSAMESMSRSGFYGDKGKGMAEQSLLAQSAGDMEQEIADKWILATNAAYKYEGEASKINEVLDGTNEITNRNSVNMTDMAEAMSTVGTSASQAGIKVNELASIIGTSVATTKKDGSEVGTAWKAILINLQNISSKKITSTLDKANASMTEMVNGAEQLRNPIAILKDLAKTYNSLDSKDPLKAEITQNIGGKHHANILSAYLTNIDQYNKMLTDYSEGSGSAMEEANKSANNLE